MILPVFVCVCLQCLALSGTVWHCLHKQKWPTPMGIDHLQLVN